MDIDIFCNKLDRGEITDFGPFLKMTPTPMLGRWLSVGFVSMNSLH